MSSPAAEGVRLDRLNVPPDIRRGVGEFVDEVRTRYGASLLSVVAFGSAVSGDYAAGESDVNLLVIHASLDIEDLERAGELSRRGLRRQMLAPRFLSKRNFDDYVRYFPVDLLAMQNAAAVLWGQNLLEGAAVNPADLRWQATYEIKAMRLRIKQQFWRIADDPRALRQVLLQRFTSLTHLMRAALSLRGLTAPARRDDVAAAAVSHLGLDARLPEAIKALRQSRAKPDRAALVVLFGDLLEAIRVVDAAIEEPAA